MTVISDSRRFLWESLGRRVTSSWPAPGVPLAKLGTIKLRSAHLKVTLQVGCALFPIPRSDLCSVAKPFPKEALGQQGRGSLNQICFPSQISKRPSEALGPTLEVLKLFNTQAVAKQRLFRSNKQCRALLWICLPSMYLCPWTALLLSPHPECDNFSGHERSQKQLQSNVCLALW